MPHKKNPDVFEIMRGKCNRLQSIQNEISHVKACCHLGRGREDDIL